MTTTTLVAHDTRISVAYYGKVSALDAGWYARHPGPYRNPVTGDPIEFEEIGVVELIEISTNFDTSHFFAVGPETRLHLWDGGCVRAGDAKKKQLKGAHGMYVVNKLITISTLAYRITNIDTTGGVYVGATRPAVQAG